jgi:hypothetical protein
VKIEIRRRDRHALLGLGAAVIVFLVVGQVLLPAYDRLAEAPEAARQKEEDLVRYRRAAERAGVALGVIADVEGAIARIESRLVPAGSANAVSVRLQAILEAAAEDAGIVLLQQNASQSRDLADGAYREISMGLNFQALPAELDAFLSRLRADPTHLAVTRLQITPIDQSTEVPEDGILGRGLQVTMTVAAVAGVTPLPAEDASESAGGLSEPAGGLSEDDPV